MALSSALVRDFGLAETVALPAVATEGDFDGGGSGSVVVSADDDAEGPDARVDDTDIDDEGDEEDETTYDMGNDETANYPEDPNVNDARSEGDRRTQPSEKMQVGVPAWRQKTALLAIVLLVMKQRTAASLAIVLVATKGALPEWCRKAAVLAIVLLATIATASPTSYEEEGTEGGAAEGTTSRRTKAREEDGGAAEENGGSDDGGKVVWRNSPRRTGHGASLRPTVDASPHDGGDDSKEGDEVERPSSKEDDESLLLEASSIIGDLHLDDAVDDSSEEDATTVDSEESDRDVFEDVNVAEEAAETTEERTLPLDDVTESVRDAAGLC